MTNTDSSLLGNLHVTNSFNYSVFSLFLDDGIISVSSINVVPSAFDISVFIHCFCILAAILWDAISIENTPWCTYSTIFELKSLQSVLLNTLFCSDIYRPKFMLMLQGYAGDRHLKCFYLNTPLLKEMSDLERGKFSIRYCCSILAKDSSSPFFLTGYICWLTGLAASKLLGFDRLSQNCLHLL